MLCCIIRSMLNCFLSLSSHLTENTVDFEVFFSISSQRTWQSGTTAIRVWLTHHRTVFCVIHMSVCVYTNTHHMGDVWYWFIRSQVRGILKGQFNVNGCPCFSSRATRGPQSLSPCTKCIFPFRRATSTPCSSCCPTSETAWTNFSPLWAQPC